jgi:dihydrofolate reductase
MTDITKPIRRRVLIAAVDTAGGIAKNGNMPWNIPEDMAHFRMMTMGHPIIMGRKTFDTIGKPLVGRTNIVISGDPFFRNDSTGALDRWITAGALVVVDSIAAAFEIAKDDPVVYVAGGLSIYEQAIQYCNEMIITTIKKDFDCDQVLVVNMEDWETVSWEVKHSEKANLDFIITAFTRKVALEEKGKDAQDVVENEEDVPGFLKNSFDPKDR